MPESTTKILQAYKNKPDLIGSFETDKGAEYKTTKRSSFSVAIEIRKVWSWDKQALLDLSEHLSLLAQTLVEV